jgi:hypothetical protein
MTTTHLSTLPEKSVQFCLTTGNFEVQVNGQVIGYAATELRGTQLANEHVYAVLSAQGGLYADLSQDDADALLSLHPSPRSPFSSPGADLSSLPSLHPICQLVREAAWLATYPPALY